MGGWSINTRKYTKSATRGTGIDYSSDKESRNPKGERTIYFVFQFVVVPRESSPIPPPFFLFLPDIFFPFFPVSPLFVSPFGSRIVEFCIRRFTLSLLRCCFLITSMLLSDVPHSVSMKRQALRTCLKIARVHGRGILVIVNGREDKENRVSTLDGENVRARVECVWERRERANEEIRTTL